MEGGIDVSIIGDMKRRCPVCRKVIDPALQKQSRRWKFYPFCSQRCKLVDLGRWLDGNYRIVTKLRPEDSEGTGEFQVEGNKDKNSGQSEMDGG